MLLFSLIMAVDLDSTQHDYSLASLGIIIFIIFASTIMYAENKNNVRIMFYNTNGSDSADVPFRQLEINGLA